MAKKTLWITFWVTMTLWLGGAIGCAGPDGDQNYRVLDDASSTGGGTINHTQRGESEGVVYVYTDDTAQDDVVVDNTIDTKTLDRSHWPKVYISAIGEGVKHDPVYFYDLETHQTTQWIVYPVTNKHYLDAALGEVDNDGWTTDNLLDIVVQPAKLIVDIPFLIPKMFVDTPLEKNITP